MLTSYYFSKQLPEYKDRVVRISVSFPKNILWLKNTRQYLPLCPSWDLVKLYKDKKISEFDYTRLYSIQLSKLNPNEIYQKLGENAILCCWEKPEKFCHRQIVAKWLSYHLKIDVHELEEYGSNGK